MRQRRARLSRRAFSAAVAAAAAGSVLLLAALHWASAPAAADAGVARAASSSGSFADVMGRAGWAVLWLVLLFMVFVALAIMCDAHLVPAIEIICKRGHIPDEIAGASLLAFGSSAPEVMINSVAVAQPHPQIDMSLPAIFGSAMIAFGLIPALCSLVVTGELELNAYPIARDSLCYAVALLMLVSILWQGSVSAWQAALLFAAFIVYMLILAAPLLRARLGSGDADGEGAKGLPKPGGSVSFDPSTVMDNKSMVLKTKVSSRNMTRLIRASTRGSDGMVGVTPEQSRRMSMAGYKAVFSSRKDLMTTSQRRGSREPRTGTYGTLAELTEVQDVAEAGESDSPGSSPRAAADGDDTSCAGRACTLIMDPFEKLCEALMLKCWVTVEPERTTVAVPADADLRSSGPRYALGIEVERGDEGLTIAAVRAGGPAAAAGVRPGFVLERITDADAAGGDGGDDDGDGDDDDALEDEEALAKAWGDATAEHAVLFHEPPSNGAVAFVFMAALVWVSVLSTLCLEITSWLADTICMPSTLAGATLLALGAQVPDTMGSVAMARAGLADGAVSNAIGSQLINVSLGVGLPFLLYDLFHGEAIQVGASNLFSLIGMGSCLAVLIVVYLCVCLSRYITCRPEWTEVELPANDFRSLRWVSPPPTGPDGETKVARIAPADSLSVYPPASATAVGLDVGVSIAEWRDSSGRWVPMDPTCPARSGAGLASLRLKVLRKGGLNWGVGGKALFAAFLVLFATFVTIDMVSSTSGDGGICASA